MPFDGDLEEIDRRSRAMAQQAAIVLGEARRKFMSGDWRWIKNRWTDGAGGVCMVEGVQIEAQDDVEAYGAALGYLVLAIGGYQGTKSRERIGADYNDRNSFPDVVAMLARARQLAEKDAR